MISFVWVFPNWNLFWANFAGLWIHFHLRSQSDKKLRHILVFKWPATSRFELIWKSRTGNATVSALPPTESTRTVEIRESDPDPPTLSIANVGVKVPRGHEPSAFSQLPSYCTSSTRLRTRLRTGLRPVYVSLRYPFYLFPIRLVLKHQAAPPCKLQIK